MVTRFEPASGLDATVAAVLARPFVDLLSSELLTAVKVFVPDAKVWITVRDEKVRDTHERTDGQTVPDNLRYKVPSTKGSGTDLGRQPRDPAFPLPNRINCRCESVPLPGVLAASFSQLPTVLQGTRVHGGIESSFPRIAESNSGTSGDQAAQFIEKAIDTVAAAHRGTRARRT
jgi:hypothetical protein